MTQRNSAEEKKPATVGKSIGRTFAIGIPATAVMTAALAVVFAVALDGCSSKGRKTEVATSHPTQASQPTTTLPSGPSPVPIPTPMVAAKKKAPVKPSTVSYNDKSSGITFRYPRKYALLTPDKGKQSEDELAKLPMNFSAAGGKSIAAVELKNGPATSFFNLSVIKGVSQDECGKFGMDSPDDKDTPIQPDDESGVAKVSLHGLDFAKADEITDQLEARYYHHFEPGDDKTTGACYEFALGVSEPPENTKPVDDVAMFEQLERIFGTVKIKPETVPAVTASIPQQSASGVNPQ